MPRKFHLGRICKNGERKRQKMHRAQGTNKMGRPSKKTKLLIINIWTTRIDWIKLAYTFPTLQYEQRDHNVSNGYIFTIVHIKEKCV